MNKKAQHLMELSVLLVVVMASILVMGPYVIRSVNAQFKGWDDSVRDSLDDPLFLAADDTPLPGCVKGPWVYNAVCGTTSCSATQRERVRTFSPIGCEVFAGFNARECYVDDTCCTDPIPQNGSIADSCEVLANPPCPEDEYGWKRWCGADDPSAAPPIVAPGLPRYGCTWDALCAYDCLPKATSTSTPAQELCVGSDIGLPSDVNYTFVSSCTGAKCEIECKVPFIPLRGGTSCGCPENSTQVGNWCYCDPGYAEQGSCSAGSCDRYNDPDSPAVCPAGACSTRVQL